MEIKANLHNIFTFIAVVEEHGFHAAARKLHLTPTAISKQIRTLERLIGQPLLERTTRNVRLTEFGAIFYEYCKSLEQEVNKLGYFLASQKIEPQGNLKVTCTPFTAYPYILPHLAEFYDRYPKVNLEIDLSERIPNFSEEDVDVLIGMSPMPGLLDNLKCCYLFKAQRILCASPIYLKKHGVPTTPEQLTNHLFINHSIRKPTNEISFSDGSNFYMKKPHLLVNNMEALVSACVDGLGVAILIKQLAQEKLDLGLLKIVLPNYPMHTMDIYLFYKATTFEQPKIRCFIDFLKEKIKMTQ